ncbi:hypothetical protein CASFOL_029105 [Castilleja foliolosa]|uniref:COP1-interacting protein 7 n=1 Tax=Castilleja foliolosa TaxID=1961234 RepID=A0ABD3CE07_9LAMI
MDSKALLDYALFQLTPTRTRCDLVVFSGKKSEKLASGLVEPFIAHLKYAKDQIPKGGYSITLRPPARPDYSSWFTKATFQRFVRFVSTPEILERITRIEREILQIDDSSTQSSESPNLEETGEESLSVSDGNIKRLTNSTKSASEEEDHGAAPRENSRVRLQRLMISRKALLQKEQAMAYARAVVAGYLIDTIDDLICFADTFGASRLRAACLEFKELYKKKHSDDQWLNELAAVQAYPVTDLSYMATTSGIMLASDSNNNMHSNSTATTTSSDHSKENNLPTPGQTPNVHQQVQWMNQIPPYMYNFQGPQQMPPYYPYYPGHIGWSPPGSGGPSNNHKPSRKKEKKSSDANETTDASEEEDEETASDESDEEIEHDNYKKHSSNGKKHTKKNKTKSSSKTVVIRNINYITKPRRNGEENGISEDYSSGDDEASIREGVDNAIKSLEKHAHSKPRKNRGLNGHVDKNEIDSNISEGGKANNSTWDAFQNLLLSHEESNSSELPKHHPGDEHFLMKNNGILNKSTNTIDDSMNFTNGDLSTKKIAFEGEHLLFAEQYNGSSKVGHTPDFSAEQATIRNRKEEDWFIVNNNSSGNSETRDAKNLEFANGPYVRKETTAVVDDSMFIVESRSAVDNHYSSHWTTDISIDADIDMPKPEKGSPALSSSVEPDELCMMLVRESRESNATWTPEMDYEVEISFNEADKKTPVVESNGHALKGPVTNGKNVGTKKNVGATTKRIGRDVLPRTFSGSVTKTKKMSPAMVQKSKIMKEEEDRKRLEEIRIERQKRIAERTAASAGKNLPIGNKSTPQKTEKIRSPGMAQKLTQAKLSA